MGVVLAGCSPQFNVSVDSICTSESEGKFKYILLPGNQGCERSDLQFIEYSSYVNRALNQSGYVQVEDSLDADLVIILSYGISDPIISQYTYSTPIYGQTGVSSSSTNGFISSNGCFTSTTSYTPSYGVIGSQTNVGTDVNFVRYIGLSGINFKKFMINKEFNEIWNTKIVSTGGSGDFRRVFPVMLAAAKDYLGKNTGKQIQITLYEEDDCVLEVKGLKIPYIQ